MTSAFAASFDSTPLQEILSHSALVRVWRNQRQVLFTLCTPKQMHQGFEIRLCGLYDISELAYAVRIRVHDAVMDTETTVTHKWMDDLKIITRRKGRAL